jgi:hypothetical protein
MRKDPLKPAIDTTGLTRKQRRALERELKKQKKKKKDAEGLEFWARDFEPIEIRIDSCTGFPHHKGKTTGAEAHPIT